MGIDTNNPANSNETIPVEPGLGPQLEIAFNPHEIAQHAIQEFLADAPVMVDRQPRLLIRKAADPIRILEFVVTIWLLTQNPFSKSFLERLGSKSADGVIELGKWAGRKLLQLLTSAPEITLLQFTTSIGGCKVEFIVSTSDVREIQAALDTLNHAANSAITLVAQMASLGPQKLVFSFDPTLKQWKAKHAATRLMGVISDDPVEVDLSKYKALSIGGELSKTDGKEPND